MHVILMGAQGSGKGTQASLIGPEFNLERIATGDMFRAEIASGSALGVQLREILDRGDLVPDGLTNNIVKGRIADLIARRGTGEQVSGALFDGFPRTETQARALDSILADLGEAVDVVIEIAVPHDTLITRLSGRRVCVNCGTVYHIESSPTTVESVCDKCGGQVVQREDDTPDAIQRRLSLFSQQTAPLLGYYGAQHKLVRVEGDAAVATVHEAISTAISAHSDPTGSN